MALDAARGSNGFGPVPLSFQEIAAFSQITGTPLLPWEVECLRRADGERMSQYVERVDAVKQAAKDKADGR